MSFLDFWSPLIRRKWHFLLTFLFFVIVLGGLLFLFPNLQKTTVYFSVKPFQTEVQNNQYHLDAVESASKVAETIAGWAQSPAFRQEIMDTADVYIPHFKRKLSARKQNRLNVFWTLTLNEEEITSTDVVVQALISTFQKRFDDFNSQNSFPFQITTPQVFTETSLIPLSWILVGILFVGLLLAFFTIYLYEVFTDKVSFLRQVYDTLPEAVVLRVEKKIGEHNANLIEQFVLTFESPRLITTFPEAEKYFSLAPLDAIDEEIDVPVLLVRLGKTTMRELENMAALFGDEVGVIVFER